MAMCSISKNKKRSKQLKIRTIYREVRRCADSKIHRKDHDLVALRRDLLFTFSDSVSKRSVVVGRDQFQTMGCLFVSWPNDLFLGGASVKYLVLLLLCSCGADWDVNRLVEKKADCKDFRNRIEQSKLSEDSFTSDIKLKIKECKAKEFWD